MSRYTRRASLSILLGGLGLGVGLLPSCTRSGGGQSGNATIKVGQLQDQTGDFALLGIQKYHAAQLAIEEINKSGGLLGKHLELISYDTQSDNRRYQELARKLILEDKVDVIHGAFTSASRAAIMPIMDQYKMLYFYNNEYEGGVCNTNTFVTGPGGDQQITTLIPEMIKKYGSKVYTIAADYNFGQITAKWIRATTEKNGGQIVGEEFIPLDVSQFSSTIDRIQKAKPDFLMTILIGAKQSSFYQQRVAAGLKVPMGSNVTMAAAYEHKRMPAPAMEDMYVTTNYMEELDTPASKAFVQKWRAKFPNEPYIGALAADEYVGMYIWAEGVKKAGTVEKEAVNKALETGVSFDGPGGKVTIDPKTHNAILTIHLVKSDAQSKITFPKVFDAVAPNWLSKEKGCDLPNKPESTQYEPG